MLDLVVAPELGKIKLLVESSVESSYKASRRRTRKQISHYHVDVSIWRNSVHLDILLVVVLYII